MLTDYTTMYKIIHDYLPRHTQECNVQQQSVFPLTLCHVSLPNFCWSNFGIKQLVNFTSKERNHGYQETRKACQVETTSVDLILCSKFLLSAPPPNATPLSPPNATPLTPPLSWNLLPCRCWWWPIAASILKYFEPWGRIKAKQMYIVTVMELKIPAMSGKRVPTAT